MSWTASELPIPLSAISKHLQTEEFLSFSDAEKVEKVVRALLSSTTRFTEMVFSPEF